MRWIIGQETSEEQSKGPYAVHIWETSRSSKFSSVQALINTNTGMEMLQIAQKNLLDNKVEVMTYFINDENMNNYPHNDIKGLKLGMEMWKGPLSNKNVC